MSIATERTVGLWMPADCSGAHIRTAVKHIWATTTAQVTRLILVLDENRNDEQRSFGEYYWMIRDAYKSSLMSMSVDDGLQVDLQVFIYPAFLAIDALLKAYPDILFYAPLGTDLPSSLIQPVTFSLDKLVQATPIFKPQREEFDAMQPHSFDVVALGGTFDRLHAGHKLMISSAIILAKKSVVIGLTDASMLASKKFMEKLLPYHDRLQGVMQFVSIFSGTLSLEIQVVPLHDPFGPTISTPAIDVLVVSEETLPGAQQINSIRVEKGMPRLHVVPVEFVKLVSGERISSTMIRSHLTLS